MLSQAVYTRDDGYKWSNRGLIEIVTARKVFMRRMLLQSDEM